MAKQIHRKLTYNTSLGKVLAKAAKRSRIGRFHVISSISDKGKWSLVNEGGIRPIKVFSTQIAAINFVKRSESKPSKYVGEVIIHGRDGRIQSKISIKKPVSKSIHVFSK